MLKVGAEGGVGSDREMIEKTGLSTSRHELENQTCVPGESSESSRQLPLSLAWAISSKKPANGSNLWMYVLERQHRIDAAIDCKPLVSIVSAVERVLNRNRLRWEARGMFA